MKRVRYEQNNLKIDVLKKDITDINNYSKMLSKTH